jgi:hypothetical protein
VFDYITSHAFTPRNNKNTSVPYRDERLKTHAVPPWFSPAFDKTQDSLASTITGADRGKLLGFQISDFRNQKEGLQKLNLFSDIRYLTSDIFLLHPGSEVSFGLRSSYRFSAAAALCKAGLAPTVLFNAF